MSCQYNLLGIFKCLTTAEKISDILIPKLAIIIPSLAIFLPRLAIYIPSLGMRHTYVFSGQVI